MNNTSEVASEGCYQMGLDGGDCLGKEKVKIVGCVYRSIIFSFLNKT